MNGEIATIQKQLDAKNAEIVAKRAAIKKAQDELAVLTASKTKLEGEIADLQKQIDAIKGNGLEKKALQAEGHPRRPPGNVEDGAGHPGEGQRGCHRTAG